jgi:hypothetical protein
VKHCIIVNSSGLCVNIVDAADGSAIALDVGLTIAPDNTGEIGQIWTGGSWIDPPDGIEVRFVGTNLAVGPTAMPLIEDLSAFAGSLAIGHNALRDLNDAGGNTAIGVEALRGVVDGGSNTAVGENAGSADVADAVNNSIIDNVFVGAGSGVGCGGNENVFVGKDSGASVVTSQSVFAGATAGSGYTGARSILIGYQCGLTGSGDDTVAVGWRSGFNAIGSSNVFVGTESGKGVSGSPTLNCVGVGYQTLLVNQASNNVSVGFRAGVALTSGSRNVLVGGSSCDVLATGVNNVHVGDSSSKLSTGSSNVVVGQGAFTAATTGFNNTIIGRAAGTDITNANNCTVIGQGATNGASGSSNRFTLGNASIATLRCQVTTITALSDERDKNDIEALNPAAAAAIIEAVRPVEFVWNMRDGAKVGIREAGFIAQDLQRLAAGHGIEYVGLVDESNHDRLEAAPHRLLPFLIAAVQQLQARVTELEQRAA